METTFQSNPQIKEWVNQIIDKNFTICLLTRIYADDEFEKGCLIITEIASLLVEISTFPSDYLEEGLRQLLKQHLPDAPVINNFPTFDDTMNKMLHEGISKVLVTQTIVADDTIENEVTEEVSPLKALKALKAFKTLKNPEPLRQVINNIFPDSKVTWNFKLFDQIFIAQVKGILIYQNDPHHPVNFNIYNKEGWRVFIYDAENLKYPRRLERTMRQFLRSGKKP